MLTVWPLWRKVLCIETISAISKEDFMTVLSVICSVMRWQGGTLTQAIQAYKCMTLEDQKIVIDSCKNIADNSAGKHELKLYYKGV